jgi:hypothetical protein
VTADIFDNLSTGLEKAWDQLKGARQLTAENIKAPMKDIRRALLEADVRSPLLSPSRTPASLSSLVRLRSSPSNSALKRLPLRVPTRV